MDALCTDRPVGRFWNNWILSTIRACESRWMLSTHLLLKVGWLGVKRQLTYLPSQSLYIEAHEPSLTTRRLKLSLNYVLKLKSLPENPACSCLFEPENTKLFEESESKVPTLSIRILPDLEKSKLSLNLVDDAPRWTSSLGNFQFLQSVLT